ncbi:MAG: hypothetical protein H6Q34_248 [Deltaproteobacteria bacterium]|nr:hypothetical protein [Deltaproteobacteria bacterium]
MFRWVNGVIVGIALAGAQKIKKALTAGTNESNYRWNL